MQTHETLTLPSGLRVIVVPTDSTVVYCGYVVRAGTRHEAPAEEGLAHLVEHMTFKGTARRRACHITNGLERVGGDLNAFTTKQETVYCATVLREDFSRAADLLTDIVFHSNDPDAALQREREVVCDEIDSYRDSPADLIFDEYEAMLFAGQPLGRDILGTTECLRAYTSPTLQHFRAQHYRPDNCAFYVLGNLSMRRVATTLQRLLPDGAAAPRPLAAPSPGEAYPLTQYAAEGTTREVEKDTHQAHVVLGHRCAGRPSALTPALSLLSNILGGPGMNARLNLALRERAALVYAVDSSLCLYPDVGMWTVYFGCDVADVARCRRIAARELQRLIAEPLTPTALRAAKKQFIGQIGISREARESLAGAIGKNFAHYGTYQDTEAACRAVQALTAEQLQRVAAEVFDPERLTTLIYK